MATATLNDMSVYLFGRIRIWLSAAVLLLAVFPTMSCAQSAVGRFEVYCDSVGFFMAKIDGAPAPGKLFLFLYLGFPGTPYIAKETWEDVSVHRNGCIADGKCEALAHGKIWLDNEDLFPAASDPTHISGKYKIELNGQHLSGRFTAKRRHYKHPPRVCM